MTGHLADTHALLWAETDPKRLSPLARDVMMLRKGAVYFSIASVWEIAIKISLGKLSLDMSVSEFVASQIEVGLKLLPVRVAHVGQLSALPLHHRDPFDRMLISQSQVEDLELLSEDPAMALYEVRVVW